MSLNESDTLISLGSLNKNQTAVIDCVDTGIYGEVLKNRLKAMGFVKGNTVRVLRRFLWGSPLQVQVGKTTVIAIRQAEANLIMVRLLCI